MRAGAPGPAPQKPQLRMISPTRQAHAAHAHPAALTPRALDEMGALHDEHMRREEVEAELRHLQSRIRKLQTNEHIPFVPSPRHAHADPLPYSPDVYRLPQPMPYLSHPGPPGPVPQQQRRRRPGLRAGMVAGAVVIIAASRVLAQAGGASLRFLLTGLAPGGTLSSERILGRLAGEDITTADAFMQCGEEDLRLAGLTVGEITWLRNQRGELERLHSEWHRRGSGITPMRTTSSPALAPGSSAPQVVVSNEEQSSELYRMLSAAWGLPSPPTKPSVGPSGSFISGVPHETSNVASTALPPDAPLRASQVQQMVGLSAALSKESNARIAELEASLQRAQAAIAERDAKIAEQAAIIQSLRAQAVGTASTHDTQVPSGQRTPHGGGVMQTTSLYVDNGRISPTRSGVLDGTGATPVPSPFQTMQSAQLQAQLSGGQGGLQGPPASHDPRDGASRADPFALSSGAAVSVSAGVSRGQSYADLQADAARRATSDPSLGRTQSLTQHATRSVASAAGYGDDMRQTSHQFPAADPAMPTPESHPQHLSQASVGHRESQASAGVGAGSRTGVDVDRHSQLLPHDSQVHASQPLDASTGSHSIAEHQQTQVHTGQATEYGVQSSQPLAPQASGSAVGSAHLSQRGTGSPVGSQGPSFPSQPQVRQVSRGSPSGTPTMQTPAVESPSHASQQSRADGSTTDDSFTECSSAYELYGSERKDRKKKRLEERAEAVQLSRHESRTSDRPMPLEITFRESAGDMREPERSPVTPVWDKPAAIWVGWLDERWVKLSSDPLEAALRGGYSLVIPEETLGEIRAHTSEPVTELDASQTFAMGLNLYTPTHNPESEIVFARFVDTLCGDGDLSPANYPGLWLPAAGYLNLFCDDVKASFPTPGILEHMFMMGTQLCEGGKWRALPLREAQIAAFVRRCKKENRETDGAFSQQLIDDAWLLLDALNIPDVSVPVIKTHFEMCLKNAPQAKPEDLIAALTITVLSWHGKDFLLSLEATPHVVTDIAAKTSYEVWHIPQD